MLILMSKGIVISFLHPKHLLLWTLANNFQISAITSKLYTFAGKPFTFPVINMPY